MTKKQEVLNLLFSRKVIVFGGEYGRCKSLSACTYCLFAFMMGNYKKILTNTPLSYGKFNQLIEIEPLIETAQFDKDNKNTLIVVDEMQRDFDFSSTKTKFFSKFAVDFRKDESQLVGMIQYIDRIPKALIELLQVIIIPTFLRTYSKDENEDLKIRLEKKDFWVNWYIRDKKFNEDCGITINLYPYLNFYLTKFKPMQLIQNHNEVIETLKKSEIGEYFETAQRKYKESLENWKKGFEQLEKIQNLNYE